ncbi:MAG: rhomboid family intramembrane serine protease [Polyangia bacterium]|jgi:membrane associated rhomboid family serine protease
MLEALGPGPLSPVTARFRALVSALLSPALPVRLDSQNSTEVQLRIERPGKPPEFVVIVDAVKEDERSLQLRLARLTSESVNDQHVVVLSNQGWLPDVLTKAAATYGSRLKLYQVDSEGKCLLGSPGGALAVALKAQKELPPSQETEEEFAKRISEAESEKQRQIDRFEERLTAQSPVATFVLAGLLALLYGLFRLWTPADGALWTQLQLGICVPRFVSDGELWRLVTGGLLHDQLLVVGLNIAVLLSLGYQTERLIGTGRFLVLVVASLLAAALFAVIPTPQLLIPRKYGFSPALFGIIGGLSGLSILPRSLPPETVARVRKVALAGVIPGAILAVLSGERGTLLAGFAVGLILVGSGLLPSLRLSDPDPPSGVTRLAQQAMVGLSALLLVGSLAVAFVVGKPWSQEQSARERFSRTMLAQALGNGKSGPAGQSGSATATGGATPEADMTPQLQSLPGVGIGLVLPKLLGDPQLQGEGAQQTIRFGDLTGKLQQLDVAVRRHEAPFKKRAQVLVAFDNAVALVKNDKQREVKAGRLTLVGEPRSFEVGDLPALEMTFNGVEGQKARTAVFVNKQVLVVLSYLYSDLLPPNLQLDLGKVLSSVKDEFADSPVEQAKGKKKKKAKKRR